MVADRSNLKSKIECNAMLVHSRRRRTDLRLRISVVIQGVGAMREDLLVLVRRGCDDRVVSEGLRKISRADRASSWEGL